VLKAFKEKLARLADDPNDPFRSAVIARVGPREAAHLEGPLRKMILALPEMLAQIGLWSRELKVSPALKGIQTLSLAYLINPEDFLPEKAHGLFGYIDDAYLVAAVFNRTLEEVGPAGMRPLIDDVGLSLRVPEWVELTRRLLPDVTEKIDAMLDTRVHGSATWERRRPGAGDVVRARPARGSRPPALSPQKPRVSRPRR
jgi:uncharacterized membrane protein YkvA (DUF1232 family)